MGGDKVEAAKVETKFSSVLFCVFKKGDGK